MTIMPSVHYDNLVTKSHSDTDDDAVAVEDPWLADGGVVVVEDFHL